MFLDQLKCTWLIHLLYCKLRINMHNSHMMHNNVPSPEFCINEIEIHNQKNKTLYETIIRRFWYQQTKKIPPLTSSTIWSSWKAARIPSSLKVKRNSMQMNSSLDSNEQLIRWFTQKSSTCKSNTNKLLAKHYCITCSCLNRISCITFNNYLF